MYVLSLCIFLTPTPQLRGIKRVILFKDCDDPTLKLTKSLSGCTKNNKSMFLYLYVAIGKYASLLHHTVKHPRPPVVIARSYLIGIPVDKEETIY